MHKQGKVWGTTQCLFSTNNVEIHRIETIESAYCSKHKHNSKYNAFYVESGSLVVKTWKGDYPLVDTTTVKAGEMTVVKPGEYHMFYAPEETVAFEIYWADSVPEDIVRETCGGRGFPWK